MKAVILAAGKSTRTYPLTVNKPKALLKVASLAIIEHTLLQLQGVVDDVVMVVGFGAEQIKQKLGSSCGKIRLSYVFQKEQLGTGNALVAAKGGVSGKFLLLMGDDMYDKADIKRCIRHKYCILSKKVDDITSFGEVVDRNGFLQNIREKPESATTGLANTGLYVVDDKIFAAAENLGKSSRGEYEITDAIKELAKKEKVAVEKAEFWIPLTYPWSLLNANEALLKGIKRRISGTVEKGATIKGEVVVGKNTLIRSGSYIEGPAIIGENCDIGPNCYIRPFTSIGNGCRIGNAVEVKASIIMDGTKIGHLSYVADSVIGEKVNFGAGTIVANLRHDNADVKSMVNGKLVSTGRRKFGTIMGDGSKTGIHTSIYPGRKIWPGKATLPGEIVRKDVV